MNTAKNYKALYNTCATQSAQKDSLIALLQQQLMQLASERQSLNSVIAAQHEELSQQAAKISDQQTTLDLQLRTITGQAEKLSQQQTIIQQQHVLIGTQQEELDKNKKELLRLGNLRFEMDTLKKWIYGIKSEKRHQPTAPVKANIGDQLTLAMEVDSWGVCKINDRRQVPGHLRIIKSTHTKKAGWQT